MDNYLTKEGLEKLKKELDYLKTTKRQEIAERLKRAISYGDLKENAAYDEAKDAQGFLEGRILELKNLIKDAVIIKKGGGKTVVIGSTVAVTQDLKGKKPETETFTIVGPVESNPLAGKISSESPLGKPMIGLKKGDIFKVNTPDGEIKYKIVEIK